MLPPRLMPHCRHYFCLRAAAHYAAAATLSPVMLPPLIDDDICFHCLFMPLFHYYARTDASITMPRFRRHAAFISPCCFAAAAIIFLRFSVFAFDEITMHFAPLMLYYASHYWLSLLMLPLTLPLRYYCCHATCHYFRCCWLCYYF